MAKETENLPVLFEHGGAAAPVSPAYFGAEEESAMPVSHYLWAIRRQVWKILVFVATCVIGTFVFSSRLQPIYESTATISIDRNAPDALVGQDSQKSPAPQDADQYIVTQVDMIQSDAVLRPVAQKFDLLQREGKLKGLSPDRIEALRNGPTKLARLRVSRPPGTYLVEISYRSPSPQLAADVANAIAKSYLEHIYRLQINSAVSASGFMERQLDGVKARMERSSQALAQFEKELNVVNPEEKTNIISARLLQLNTEYTNAQADRVKKEAVFNAMKGGSLATEQISGLSDDLQKRQERINDAQEKFAEIKATKGINHPDYRTAESRLRELKEQYDTTRLQIAHRIEADYRQSLNREQMLQAAVNQIKAEFDKINERSFDYQRLKQDADANKKLYEELVTKIQEAGINAGFQNKNTAISNEARPAWKPIFPNLKLNLLLAGVLATFLAVGAVILLDSMDSTIREPEQIVSMFGTDAIGALPLVRELKTRSLTALPSAASSETALSRPDRALRAFDEAVRMLRNSILLGDSGRRVRSILFTSATPAAGKSTIAMHLAIAHAEQGQKTLLIDADLRCPTLHTKLGLESTAGLAQVLTHESSWEAAIVQFPNTPNLHFLPSGAPSWRATDLLGTGIADILDETSRLYDLVIIDAPPMLGFAEPMQLAIAVDGVVIVALAGETSRKAIKAVVDTLRRLRANIVGIALNRMGNHSTNGYYYSRYYNYYQKDQS